MIEQKFELHSLDDSKQTIQINVVINQFLFFTQNEKQDRATESSSSQEQAPDSCATTYVKKLHSRSIECNEDVAALIPYAQKVWIEEIATKQRRPSKIGKGKLAEKLLSKLPTHFSLNCERKKSLPRVLKALELTDPRIYDEVGGSCKGLKPHWEKFEWVKI
jgi:hypothetical protein